MRDREEDDPCEVLLGFSAAKDFEQKRPASFADRNLIFDFSPDSGSAPRRNGFDCNARRAFMALCFAKETVHRVLIGSPRIRTEQETGWSDGSHQRERNERRVLVPM